MNKIKKRAKEIEKEVEKCPFCSTQENAIEECAKNHGVDITSEKQMFKHVFTCAECKIRLNFIKDCTKKGHK